jgi:uncharacterized phage protein (TIGR02218 family)
MRKVIDNSGVTAGTTQAMLDSMTPFARIDLVTFQLTAGPVVRFAAFDWPITYAGNVFSNSGPQFLREGVKHKRGVDVDEMTLQLLATESNTVIGSMGWATAAREGVLDGALFSLDLAFFKVPFSNTGNAPSPTGFMNWFSGYVDEITSIDPPTIEMKIKSDMGRLAIEMPRNCYQLTCVNTLFDCGCTLNQSSYAITGTVVGVQSNGDISVTLSAGGLAANYFSLGSLYWATGANAGVVRGIKYSATGGTYIAFYQPTPMPIQTGDTFTVYPGCDKTQATCTSKFGNVINFRGTPFVPTPEVVL